MKRFRTILFVLIWLSASLGATLSFGQTTYPQGTVRFIVAYGAGGPTDAFARYVAHALSERWGTAVVVENRPGAVGLIAQRAVVSAKPDGYTLLFGTAMGTPLLAEIPVDQIPDLSQFEPIVQTGVTAMHITVRSDLNINSVADLVRYAKSNPGKLHYSASIGSPPYMAFERFRIAAGLDIVTVPLPGSNAQIMGLLTNTIQIAVLDTQSVATAQQNGSAKAIALIGNRRAEQLPDVPSLAEQGFTGISVVPWYGLLGPKGLPTDIRDKIAADVMDLLGKPSAHEALKKIGFETLLGGPEVLKATVTDEIEGTRRDIAELGKALPK